jgi:cell division protein FtsA
MEEISRYAVGVDIGTSTVRCVVASLDNSGNPMIVGFSETQNSGMSKGVINKLAGPASAIDSALGEVERMSGYEVNEATISINGSHILSTKTDGMVVVGAVDHEITYEDLDRIDEVAAVGKIPANREILDITPYGYRLDGQGNIKDPVGMIGTRLEVKANVISALSPYCQNLNKVADMAELKVEKIVAAPVAAAKAVLNERQLENGVAVIDIGSTTTGISIFEEGDLQFASVIAIGSNSITKDLAMGLKTDPEVAEDIKIRHASAVQSSDRKNVVIRRGKEELTFDRNEMDEIVEARLEEIFDLVRKDLKRAGYDHKLPEGVILTGGGAKLKDIVDYAKNHLELSVKIGHPSGFAGIGESIEKPEYATATGLMLISAQNASVSGSASKKKARNGGLVKKIFSKFKAK